jgi:hypothetical protein
MNVKKCSLCGWEYPAKWLGRNCEICGNPMDVLTCSVCGEVKPVEAFAPRSIKCKACKSKYDVIYMKIKNIRLDNMFDDWVAKISKVPKDYPTLTEEQWLEACQHFDGCARCGCKDIDTRGFFISAKLGGRYCNWNIIPLCEKCANTWNLEKSVFRYVEKRAYNEGNLDYKKCLVAIIDYLSVRLDEAIKETDNG